MSSGPDSTLIDTAAAMSLMSPRSIAIVGASERSRWSTSMIQNLDGHGFPGEIRLVNPRGGRIGDRTVATSCADIGESVDLAVLMVPSSAVVGAIHELAATGTKSAMILTSGFAEVGPVGQALQDEICEVARAAGIRLLGPNSLGFMNFVDSAVGWAAPTGRPSRTDGVGLVSQSGATAYFLADLAFRQDIPVSYVVATGNEADLDLTTFACGLAADPHTRAVALFIESVRNPARFVAAAEAANRAGKPLVVLKVGASEITARSALAHTGALVGDDRVFDGICQQYGIIRVHSLEELMTTADIVGRTGILRAGGLAVVSNSGGVCEIAADSAHALGIDLPGISESALSVIHDATPDFATPHNPLDLTGGIVPADCERIVAALGSAPEYAALMVPYYQVPTEAGVEDKRLTDLHRHLAKGLRDALIPGFLVSYTSTTVSQTSRNIIDELEIPYLACGMDRALAGLSSAFWWSERHRSGRLPTGKIAADKGLSLIGRPASEFETRAVLVSQGVPVMPRVLVTDTAGAIAAAGLWDGPSVLKIASPDITHKTEIGGVALNVAGDANVAAAFARVLAAGQAQPGAVIDGVLICPMRGNGVELFVGCSYDPVWGPVIAVGLGGIWVEVLDDVAIRPLPVSADEVVRLLGRLRGAAILRGARGTLPADLQAVGSAIAAIGDVAVRLGPDLAALDVNPLWVRGDQVEALDALAIWTDA